MKIFVVDDDPDFAEGMVLNLQVRGHEVDFATSGEAAVDQFRAQDFDIIFMDVRMPGMNGVDSLIEMQKIRPEAKVVMMTAFTVDDLLRQAMEAGAFSILHKPFGVEQILEILQDVGPAGLVLIADDDADFAEGLKRVLTAEGYGVSVARTGQQALDMLLADGFDVLLLDIRLPVLNGSEVYKALKERGRAPPTIIVTGYETEEAESIQELRRMSVKGCLTKPVRSAELLQFVGRLMS